MKKYTTLLLLVLTTFVFAQNQSQPTIDVIGEGIVTVVPDEVTVTVRVENTGKDATLIKQENDRIVANVLDFVSKMSIDKKDVKTQYVRLDKNYDYNTKTYSYAANQSIAITLKDLSKYEGLMNGLLKSGINRIDGVQFSASNMDALVSQARIKAIQNGKIKATEYATALGQSIGNAVAVSEPLDKTNYPQPMYKTMAMDSNFSGAEQTLAPGEMEIKKQVLISFLLKN